MHTVSLKNVVALLAGHPFGRMERLVSRLNDNAEFKAVAVPSDECTITSSIVLHRPDILLYDFQRGEEGITILEEIVRLFDEIVRVIALTDCTDITTALMFVQSGGWGYLLNRCSDEDILAAIHRVASGEKTFCPTLGWEVLTSINTVAPPFSSALLEKLPYHLLRILPCLQRGETLEEIAEKSFISPKTARLYRQTIMQKLGVHSAAELERRLLTSKIE